MDWIGLTQDRDRWRTLVSGVMNLRVPWNAGNFLTSCKPVSFSRRTLHQLDAQNFCFTISLLHASTCFEHHVLIIRRSKFYYTASGIIIPIGGRPLHRTATYRVWRYQMLYNTIWPPDDEHMCSKHVEAWNKLTVKQKFCASSWLITKINILRWTVSKTSPKKYHLIFVWPCITDTIIQRTN